MVLRVTSLIRFLLLAALWASAIGAAAGPPPSAVLTIHGRVVLPDAAERSAGGQIVVELRDTQTDRVLAEQRLPLDASAPTQRFRLRLPRAGLSRDQTLSLRGALLERGGTIRLSEPVAVDPASASVNAGALVLARAPRPLAFQTHIDCRLRQFVVGMAGDTLTLRDGEHSFALQPSAADPDQRFEAVGDPTTFVQTSGTAATVTVRGVTYAGCSLLR